MSLLALEAENVTGFVINTMSDYENIPTIYNGGVGVISSRRRTGIARKLFEAGIPSFVDSGARRMVLEVLTDNEPAISFYEKLGFTYSKTFRCFKRVGNRLKKNNLVEITKITRWDPAKYELLRSFYPSCIDSDTQLIHNIDQEVILEARIGNEPAGFTIFQPRLGRISQIAVDPKMRGQGIGSELIRSIINISGREDISVMNIPDDQDLTIASLECLGFANQINQFELELLI